MTNNILLIVIVVTLGLPRDWSKLHNHKSCSKFIPVLDKVSARIQGPHPCWCRKKCVSHDGHVLRAPIDTQTTMNLEWSVNLKWSKINYVLKADMISPVDHTRYLVYKKNQFNLLTSARRVQFCFLRQLWCLLPKSSPACLRVYRLWIKCCSSFPAFTVHTH